MGNRGRTRSPLSLDLVDMGMANPYKTRQNQPKLELECILLLHVQLSEHVHVASCHDKRLRPLVMVKTFSPMAVKHYFIDMAHLQETNPDTYLLTLSSEQQGFNQRERGERNSPSKPNAHETGVHTAKHHAMLCVCGGGGGGRGA